MSSVVRFKSSLADNQVKFKQHFPAKYLDGDYEIQATMLGIPYQTSGTFSLSLFNYSQSTTVKWIPTAAASVASMKLRIVADDVVGMTVHVSNMLGGRTFIESILDRVINIAWRPGFAVLKPTIDDIVSNAFTKLFNEALRDFPFDAIIARN